MKRASVITATFIIASTVVVVGIMTSGRTWVPLFTDIPTEQLPLIVGKLQEKQVPYQILDGGKTIEVPPEFRAQHANDADERNRYDEDRVGWI